MKIFSRMQTIFELKMYDPMKLKLQAVIDFASNGRNHVETMELIHNSYREASMSRTSV